MLKIINDDEKIVRVKIKLNPLDEDKVVRWVIKDEYLGYYRTKSGLRSDMAWNRSIGVAWLFTCPENAQEEMDAMIPVREALFQELISNAWEENTKSDKRAAKCRKNLLGAF